MVGYCDKDNAKPDYRCIAKNIDDVVR